MIDLYSFDPHENMTGEDLREAGKKALERTLKIFSGELEYFEGVDLSDIYIDPSIPVPLTAPFALEMIKGITSNEAQMFLYSERAFYCYSRGSSVYHITERKHISRIMKKGLLRAEEIRGEDTPDTRGIFFISDPEELTEELFGVEEPVIIEIDKRSLRGADLYKDSQGGDIRLTSMYADIDRIAPEFLRVIEEPGEPEDKIENIRPSRG